MSPIPASFKKILISFLLTLPIALPAFAEEYTPYPETARLSIALLNMEKKIDAALNQAKNHAKSKKQLGNIQTAYAHLGKELSQFDADKTYWSSDYDNLGKAMKESLSFHHNPLADPNESGETNFLDKDGLEKMKNHVASIRLQMELSEEA